MPGEEARYIGYQMYAGNLWSNLTWVCANLGFIVHTVCRYSEMVASATAASNKVSKAFGGGLNSCKLRMRVQHLGMNKYIPLVSCVSNLFTSWHCLLRVTVYSAEVVAEHIQL